MIGTNRFEGTSNISGRERWTTALTGAALALLGLRRKSVPGALMAAGGGALLLRAVSGYCPGYAALSGSKPDTRTALGGSRGVHVDESVTVNRPAHVLYDSWRSLEALPRFMRHLVSVRQLSESRSHWVAKAPGGRTVEWDAEIINDVPNHLIGWRSVEGADVASAGSVKFTPINSGQETEVEVRLQYDPPAGKAGAAVAWMLGKEPSQTIREGLRRFKAWMETGEVPILEGRPRSLGAS